MDIDKAIRIFADFLNASYLIITPLLTGRSYTSDDNSTSDWLQLNWEILVERKVLPLNEYLEAYGEGADFYGSSSRITDMESLPTYSVKVQINKGIDILNNTELIDKEFFFERLIGFKNNFYTDEPLFNYVLVQDENIGIERVFPIENIKFKLRRKDN